VVWPLRPGSFIAPPFAGLLNATWLELPSRSINEEVFQDEMPFAALQWTTAVSTFDLSVQPNMIDFDPNQLVLRIAVWTIE
jgi:hypothetical protein